MSIGWIVILIICLIVFTKTAKQSESRIKTLTSQLPTIGLILLALKKIVMHENMDIESITKYGAVAEVMLDAMI